MYHVKKVINGFSFRITDNGVIVESDTDVFQYGFIAALRIAQQIEPTISMCAVIRSYPHGWYQVLSDDALPDFIAEAEQWLMFLDGPERDAVENARIEDYKRSQGRIVKESKKKPAVPKRPGFVYLLASDKPHVYKIGRTTNPESRVKTFSVKLPFQVRFEHIIETDDMIGLEKTLHARFAEHKVNGEWFWLEPAQVNYIKSLGGEA